MRNKDEDSSTGKSFGSWPPAGARLSSEVQVDPETAALRTL
jgi:hypothetical protein